MALKALMLNKRLEEKKAKLAELRSTAEKFKTRENELEKMIEEAETEEEKNAVDEEIEKFEKEKTENSDEQDKLIKEIGDIETELADMDAPPANPAPEGRSKNKTMTRRTKFFGMTVQERDAFLNDEEVKGFLERVREKGQEKRSVKGSELLIPETVLDVVRENISEHSKLISKVTVRSVPGKARQNITGKIPEAIWLEACAKLNELDFGFAQIAVNSYKVGGVITISNSTLEDSDINLSTEIITMLGAAIGIAIDKAILYGTGVNMPQGIVPRLAQQTKPVNYSIVARDWEDLHEKNIKNISGKHGVELFKEINNATKAMKGKYSTGNKIWIMNESTRTELISEAMNINAAGVLTSTQLATMPVIGGEVVIVSDDVVPDGNIVAGYADLYLLAERDGATFGYTDLYKYVEDQTVFKGTARYDGAPIIAEAFIAIGLNTTPVTAVTFAGDDANDTRLTDIIIGGITLSPEFSSETFEYTAAATNASDTVIASPKQKEAEIVITYKNKHYPNGADIKWTTGKNIVYIEVTMGLSIRTYTVTVTK